MFKSFFINKRILLSLALYLFAVVAQAGILVDAQLAQNGSETRLKLSFDEQVTYSYFSLNSPDRLVIDLRDSSVVKSLKPLFPQGGLLKKIRTGQPRPETFRLVLDLSAKPDTYELSGSMQSNGIYELHVMMQGEQGASPESPATPVTRQEPVAVVEAAEPKPASRVVPQAKRHYIVAIDAGHGGTDPGAIGPRKTKEKHVAAQVAARLYTLLKAAPEFTPVLTRPGDRFVSLSQRPNRAREQNADLFVSLHADSFDDSRARGASVYSLSATGASSEHARWLAEKENAADLVGGISISDKESDLAGVLLDLVQVDTLESSFLFGGYVLNELSNIAHMHKRDVQTARFMVLKAPDIPSVLVEMGFISNPKEERMLNSSSYQQKLANSLYLSISRYFADNPVMEVSETKIYTVKSGDTLGGIAERHRISLADLKQLNQLQSNVIHVGQQLTIPSRT